MSTASQEDGVQREEQSQSAGLTTITTDSYFGKLSPEMLILILCNFTLEKLIAFRCSCRWANDFVLLHQRAIFRGFLENAVSRAAAELYLGLTPPTSWTFNNLIGIARRCSIAQEIAHLLVQCQSTSSSCLYYSSRPRERSASDTARFAKIAYPYILALIEFFEEYWSRLASFVPDPNVAQTPSDQVERLLLARYNEQTVNRLCALYHILHDLLRFQVPYEKLVSMFTLLGITRAGYPVLADGEHLDFLTFGGLEVFKDVMTQDYHGLRMMVAHFSRVTPLALPVTYDGQSYTTFVPLTRSLLPRMNDPNNVNATRVCLRLPRAADFLRNDHSEEAMDVERARFIRYLKCDDGEEEPDLLWRRED